MGADRGHSRRQRARLVSTDGKPRSKNQLSAAALPPWRPGLRRSERSMRAHPSGAPVRLLAVARTSIARLLTPRFAGRIVAGLGRIARLLTPRFAGRIVAGLGRIARLL